VKIENQTSESAVQDDTERGDTIPLDRAVLCLDCETIFRVERRQCPACHSRTFSPIWTWLHGRRFLRVTEGERR